MQKGRGKGIPVPSAPYGVEQSNASSGKPPPSLGYRRAPGEEVLRAELTMAAQRASTMRAAEIPPAIRPRDPRNIEKVSTLITPRIEGPRQGGPEVRRGGALGCQAGTAPPHSWVEGSGGNP